MHGYFGYGYNAGVWSWIMPIVMVAFWALVATAVVLSIRHFLRHGGKAGGDSALDILKKRYARGEINKAEFDEKKNDLA